MQQQKQCNKQHQKQSEHFTPLIKTLSISVAIGVVGRLMPHVPNVTPFTALSLLVGAKLQHRRLVALLTMIVALITSDVLLAYIYGYPVFSLWTIFTYSSFLVITLCGRKLATAGTEATAKCTTTANWKTLPCWISAMSLGYWLWTNFGVWLTSNLYAKSFAGLLSCYVAALPFLRNAVIGDLVWGIVIFGAFSLVTTAQRRQQSRQQLKSCI